MLTERERIIGALLLAKDVLDYVCIDSWEREVTESDRKIISKVVEELQQVYNYNLDDFRSKLTVEVL